MIISSFAEHFPKTKDELIDCVQTENCAPFRERAKTHISFLLLSLLYCFFHCWGVLLSVPWLVQTCGEHALYACGMLPQQAPRAV